MPLTKPLQHLKSCSEELNIGLFSLDQTGSITLWDKKISALTGYEYHEVKGISLTSGSHNNFQKFGYQSRSKFLAKWPEFNSQDKVADFDWHVNNKDGRKLLLRTSFLGSYTNGKHAEYMFLAVDITSLQDRQNFLNASFELLARTYELSSRYKQIGDNEEVFIQMLDDILQLCESEYGFAGEIRHEPDGKPYLVSRAITNIAWTTETLDFYNNRPMIFRNLDTLFGYTMKTGELMIANDPQHNPHAGGLPKGHPPLNAFLGIPLKNKDGELVGMIGLANKAGGYNTRITEQVKPFLDLCADIFADLRMARDLRSFKKRNSMLFNNTPLMHFSTRKNDKGLVGILIEANDVFIDNLRRDSLDVLGHSTLEFFSPDSHKKILDIVNRLESGINQTNMTVLTAGNQRYSTIVNMLDRDNKSVPIEITIALDENLDGNVTGLNITGKKISVPLDENAYRQTIESEWVSLINSFKVAIFAADMKGIMTEWNQNMAYITGIASDDVIGHHYREFIFLKAVKKSLKKIRLPNSNTEKHQAFEIDIRGKNDRPITMLISVVEKHDTQGNIIGIRAIGQDITLYKEQNYAILQAQKMEAIGTMAGGLAHDLNNILTIIRGNLELLWSTLSKSDDLRDMIDDALSSANEGYDITRRLMAFSRTQPIQIRDIPLNSILNNFLRIMKRSIGNGIDISMAGSDEEIVIRADPNQLETAMLNLVINAKDAIRKSKRKDGQIGINISHQIITGQELELEYLQPNKYAIITISDNGCGMPPAVRIQALNPYFTTKPVGTGSGLGLPMVYGFVRQSNGGISILSNVGKGTIIKLYLPVASLTKRYAAGLAIVEGNTRQDKSAVNLTHVKNILVVDDNEKVLRIVARSIEDWGFRTYTAETADQALRILGDHDDIDLVLSDIIMHGSMSGRQLAKEVTSLYPHIKIILMTGYEPDNLKKKSADDTNTFVLYKPYTRESFFKTLNECFNKREIQKSEIKKA